MLPEKFFDTGELTINYAEGGESGPPLVLLHGLTGRWQDFQPVIPQLTPKWHVYACDLRGHGKSGRIAGHYHLTDYLRDLIAFLGQKTKEPAVLLAHSLGALIALGVASKTPECVRALALLDPPLIVRNTTVEVYPRVKNWFDWVYETMKSAPSYENVVARYRELAPDADKALINAVALNVYSVAPEAVSMAHQDNRLMAGFDLERTVQTVGCPTLLLRGEWQHGSTIRDKDAEWFQAKIPHARIIQIAKGSHHFLWKQMEVTIEFIQSFLQTV